MPSKAAKAATTTAAAAAATLFDGMILYNRVVGICGFAASEL
jgi:hypothetical protein